MVQFQRFVEKRMGPGGWETLLERAKLPNRRYLAIEAYPDEEIAALVAVASEVTSIPAAQLLESFGEFIVPGLFATYGAYLSPGWRTLEVVENTEETIHNVVRRQNPSASPPRLKAERISPVEVQVHYTSERRMCAVARGIVRGVAKHFSEAIEIDEPSCMLRGGRSCELIVRRLGQEAPPR